jgi:hypothetical protein
MMVTLLPIVLAPTFLAAAEGEGQGWSAYYNAAIVSLVYGLFASVQSTLDDPFGCVKLSRSLAAEPRIVSAVLATPPSERTQ